MTSARKSIAVLMTCHNRREQTAACVASIQVASAAIAERYRVQLYVTDDGSTDGTAAAVRAIDPGAIVLAGSGDLFWNGGMRLAFGAALADGHDVYLWMNDDVTLFADSLDRLTATWEGLGNEAAILVGSTQDDTGTLSYGGVGRPFAARRTHFALVPPGDTPKPAETFNGNCVLIPAAAAARLGNLDPDFVHCIGDFDYGLRATELGIRVLVTPGVVGTCGRNDPRGTYNDAALPLAERWRKLTSDKGLPLKGWLTFCRRHAGPAWPIFAAWPYAKTVLSALRR